MVDIHMIIGLATVAAFLLLTIVNGLRAFRGSELSWARVNDRKLPSAACWRGRCAPGPMPGI